MRPFYNEREVTHWFEPRVISIYLFIDFPINNTKIRKKKKSQNLTLNISVSGTFCIIIVKMKANFVKYNLIDLTKIYKK